MRGKLIDLDESCGTLRAVCLRIKAKFQTAVPRLARGCYNAGSMTESLNKVRAEFDLVLSGLSSINGEDLFPDQAFQVVYNDPAGSQSED